MKKFNETDIEKMLSKTEKTAPSFETKVNFAARKPLTVRRRSIIIPMVACLAVITVTVGMIFSVPEKTPPDVVPPVQSSEVSNDFTYVSDNSISFVTSEVLSDDSYEHSDFSYPFEYSGGEHFPSVSGDTSDMSVPDNVVYPTVDYPSNNLIFTESVLKDGQDIDEYFTSNHIKFLEARLELPIYRRMEISDSMKRILVDAFSSEFGLELIVVDDILNDDKIFRAIDLYGNTFEISDFGDWELNIKQTILSIEHKNENNDNGFYELSVAEFIAVHSSIFGSYQYKYITLQKETAVLVEVFETNGDIGLLSEYPIYTFEFSVGDNKSSLVSIKHYNHRVETLGNFKTRLYDSATNALFANIYYSADGFEFSDGDAYVFLGYDVRYIISEYESLICPYYAFVLRVQHADESTSIQTLFVPAIDERHLG